MKKFLIHLLFRLIDRTPKTRGEVKEKIVRDWLKEQFKDVRIREYISVRDTSILRQVGNGLSREDYLIWIGRRYELLSLLEALNKAGKQLKE